MQTYFNDLKADLKNERFFPPYIYEPRKNNPNPAGSSPCVQRNNSLDAYVSTLTKEILKSLKGRFPIFPKGKILNMV
jgi:hypothetical protein